MQFKLLITTSGTGSRLGTLTQTRNKALVPLAGRAALDFILDRYHGAIPIVMTVGYRAGQVIEFMRTHYAGRTIQFIPVAPYDGPGSSLGYSMLQAEAALQCPFIFHACDTIIRKDPPAPDHNWTGGYQPPAWQDIDPASYRTHHTDGRKLLRLNEKGEPNFTAIHIGLTGIYDYRAFWRALRRLYESNPDRTDWSDVHVIAAMLTQGIPFTSLPVKTWLDTGNPAALAAAEQHLQSAASGRSRKVTAKDAPLVSPAGR